MKKTKSATLSAAMRPTRGSLARLVFAFLVALTFVGCKSREAPQNNQPPPPEASPTESEPTAQPLARTTPRTPRGPRAVSGRSPIEPGSFDVRFWAPYEATTDGFATVFPQAPKQKKSAVSVGDNVVEVKEWSAKNAEYKAYVFRSKLSETVTAKLAADAHKLTLMGELTEPFENNNLRTAKSWELTTGKRDIDERFIATVLVQENMLITMVVGGDYEDARLEKLAKDYASTLKILDTLADVELTRFTPPGCPCAVHVPRTPSKGVGSVTTPAGRRISEKYVVQTNAVSPEYSIEYLKITEDLRDRYSDKELLDGAVEGFLAANEGELEVDGQVILNGNKGRSLMITNKDRRGRETIAEAEAYFIADHVVIVSATYLKPAPRTVDAYFQRFELKKTP